MQPVACWGTNSALDWTVGVFWVQKSSPREAMWMKDLARTGVRKMFLVLGLLRFTSIKCEGKNSENLNLCYSLGIIFLLFDLYLDFNFAPNVSDWKRRLWALQAWSAFSGCTSWRVERNALPSHRPLSTYSLRPSQLPQHCNYHCDRYLKGLSTNGRQGRLLQGAPWWLSPFNNLENDSVDKKWQLL